MHLPLLGGDVSSRSKLKTTLLFSPGESMSLTSSIAQNVSIPENLVWSEDHKHAHFQDVSLWETHGWQFPALAVWFLLGLPWPCLLGAVKASWLVLRS